MRAYAGWMAAEIRSTYNLSSNENDPWACDRISVSLQWHCAYFRLLQLFTSPAGGHSPNEWRLHVEGRPRQNFYASVHYRSVQATVRFSVIYHMYWLVTQPLSSGSYRTTVIHQHIWFLCKFSVNLWRWWRFLRWLFLRIHFSEVWMISCMERHLSFYL